MPPIAKGVEKVGEQAFRHFHLQRQLVVRRVSSAPEA
jgi:hypothetical protein